MNFTDSVSAGSLSSGTAFVSSSLTVPPLAGSSVSAWDRCKGWPAPRQIEVAVVGEDGLHGIVAGRQIGQVRERKEGRLLIEHGYGARTKRLGVRAQNRRDAKPGVADALRGCFGAF